MRLVAANAVFANLPTGLVDAKAAHDPTLQIVDVGRSLSRARRPRKHRRRRQGWSVTKWEVAGRLHGGSGSARSIPGRARIEGLGLLWGRIYKSCTGRPYPATRAWNSLSLSVHTDELLAKRWALDSRADYDRCVAARCGELGALQYFRETGRTARDISITQLADNPGSVWRSHEHRGGTPLHRREEPSSRAWTPDGNTSFNA